MLYEHSLSAHSFDFASQNVLQLERAGDDGTVLHLITCCIYLPEIQAFSTLKRASTRHKHGVCSKRQHANRVAVEAKGDFAFNNNKTFHGRMGCYLFY